jgi:polyisoprenoid-binding protein YceI
MSATAPSTLEGTWALDKLHSTASFAVKHMVVSTFRTRFKDIDATVPAESIDIEQPDFRGHLMSAEFFDVANTPNIEFRSTSVRRGADDSAQVDGELTVKGITQPVTATGSLTGPVADVMGNDRVGVELEAEVDRSLYDLNWNAPLPKGGEALGRKVTLAVHLEFVRQEA